MMARILLTTCILFPTLACCQKMVKEFYDENSQVTDSVFSYYYKVGKKGKFIDLSHLGFNVKDSVISFTDTVFSYYSSTGKIRTREIYREGALNGPFISYHENGRIHEKGIYFFGDKVGYFMSWYREGIPQQTVQFPDKSQTYFPAMINYWDSLGRSLVNNGKGFCHCFNILNDGGILKEDGKVTNGLRDSVWIGHINDTLAFIENYNNGEFLGGIRYNQRQEYKYAKLDEPPEFPGGMEAMMKFIMRTMKYPAEARRAGTEGRVFVAYVINLDGSIGDIRVDKGVSDSLDREAVRVIKLMPNWKPGTQRGVPVRVKFVMPLNFKLAH